MTCYNIKKNNAFEKKMIRRMNESDKKSFSEI
jgi:hypothetical protein